MKERAIFTPNYRHTPVSRKPVRDIDIQITSFYKPVPYLTAIYNRFCLYTRHSSKNIGMCGSLITVKISIIRGTDVAVSGGFVYRSTVVWVLCRSFE